MSSPRRWILHTIFLLSGAAALAFQMASVRIFAAVLGHELPAALAVVGAFFGGLSVGAWALDRPIARSPRPGIWYAGLEVVIGLWGVACVGLAVPASELALHWMGPTPSMLHQWTLSLGLPLVVLLPATAAMGATLPAMERLLAGVEQGGRHVGGLYAANCFGAVAGTLGAAFVLVPMLGYRTTLLCVAALNVACALLVLPWLGVCVRCEPRIPQAHPRVARGPLMSMLFLTGLLGIGYQVVVLRVLAHVIENTTYSYAAVLSVWLIGTAAGATAYQRWQGGDATNTVGRLLCLLAASCLPSGFALAVSPELYELSRDSFGDTMLGVLLSELTVAASALLLPTALMGSTFSLLAQEAKRLSGGVGAALALNTIGAFLAPPTLGIFLLPALGARWSLASIALGYVVVAAFARLPLRLAALSLVGLMLIPDLRWIRTFDGQTILSYREGILASVAILGDAEGHRSLRVNNRFVMGDTGRSGLRMQRRQGHLPLLLHPSPDRALYLGVGTGVTALAAADHPGLRVDAVELVPEIVEALPAFAVQGRSLDAEPHVRVHVADARRFVRTTSQRFDVIVGDLFHPRRDGGGMLYTLEHFEAVRARLASNGLFCQWLPTYQLDEPTLRDVIRTFLAVFPGARAVMHDLELNFPAIALVGARNEWPTYGPGWMERRVRSEVVRDALAEVDLDTDLNLFGLWIGDANALASYAGAGPYNKDDHPVVVYGAPLATALRGEPRYGRLLSLLRRVGPQRDAWSIRDPEFGARLRDILERRNAVIERSAAAAQGDPRMIESTIPNS